MQEQLSYVAAIQAKEQIEAEIELFLKEKEALLANVKKQIKEAHSLVSQNIAVYIAERIGLDENFLSRLIHNVFGFEEPLVNLEPIKFQPFFHCKEMNHLRDTLEVLEENGLVEIDHIFTSDDGKRYLINSFLPEVKCNLANGQYNSPLTNTPMARHEFYRHYFQIVHMTEKFMDWIAEAIYQRTIDASANDGEVAPIEPNCVNFQAVA